MDAVATKDQRSERTATSTRHSRFVAPLTALGITASAAAYFGLTNPHEGSLLPPCLLLSTTGLDCPLCGGSRAIHDLVRGNITEAADHNLLVVVLAPIAILGLIGWFVALLRRSRPDSLRDDSGFQSFIASQRGNTLLIGGLILLLAFAVVRNLPQFPFLDSGLG